MSEGFIGTEIFRGVKLLPTDQIVYVGSGSRTQCQGVFTLSDARSFSELTSKIPPLGSMLNFDADVKKTTARHQCENRFNQDPGPRQLTMKTRVVLPHVELCTA